MTPTVLLAVSALALLAVAVWQVAARWVVRSINWAGPLTLDPPQPLELIWKAAGRALAQVRAAVTAIGEAFTAAVPPSANGDR